MSVTHDEILLAAVPGHEYTPPRRSLVTGDSSIERPRKYWFDGHFNWAVYTVTGDRVGDTVISSVNVARTVGLRPILVVRDNTELKAVADRYVDLHCHVACPVAGHGSLIPPLDLLPQLKRKRKEATRIPIDLLRELSTSKVFPPSIHRALKTLFSKYLALPRTGDRDKAEQTALEGFLKSELHRMGFGKTGDGAVGMVRNLERAGWGGRRDHFFHSFQNYFFGLYAIGSLSKQFTEYRAVAKLDWDVDSYHVWFLAALWHDVGYGISHLEDIHDDVMGTGFSENCASSARVEFLKSATTQEALLSICTLMSRLLKPENVRTGWMTPAHWPRGNATVTAIKSAFEESVMHQGHGAPSAIRLYSDFVPHTKRLGTAKHDVLLQVVLMACASLPFHDDKFREHLRNAIGPFAMKTSVMPFATLLAFVDSIQDDRRDLDGVKDEIRFLERILVSDPAIISAKVNQRSLHPSSLLFKAVEARDVFSHLVQDKTSLYFKYPEWMVQ